MRGSSPSPLLASPGCSRLWCAAAAGHSRGARSCGWDGAGPRHLGPWCGQRGLPRPPTWLPPAAAGDPALRVTLTLLPAGTECGQSVCSLLSIRGEPEKPLGSPRLGPNPTTARTSAAPRQRITPGPSPCAALRSLHVGAGTAWHGSWRGARWAPGAGWEQSSVLQGSRAERGSGVPWVPTAGCRGGWHPELVAPRAGPQRGERLLPPAALLAPRCPQNPAVGRHVGGVGMLWTTHLGSPVGGRWGGARVQPAELCPHWHMLIACNGENVIS